MSVTADYCAAGLEVLVAAREAARTEPAVARVWREVERWRHVGNGAVVRSLAERGQLRRGLDRAEATDTLWTLTAHDVYRLQVQEPGWAQARSRASLTALLLRELAGQ